MEDHIHWGEADEYRQMQTVNHILAAIEFIIILSLVFIIFFSSTNLPPAIIFLSYVGMILFSIRIIGWWLVRTAHRRDLRYLMVITSLPFLIDILLIFAIGLGILMIVLRIIILSTLYNESELEQRHQDEHKRDGMIQLDTTS